jgi:hypothetical protein
MTGYDEPAMKEDLDHLRLLAIFHYVVAAMVGLFSLFPVIHLAIGIAAITGRLDDHHGGQPMPALFGWFFVVFASAWMLMGFAFAICLVLAGRFLARRKHYLYCLIMACFACMCMPFGTVLGVFTILVLMRPSVKELFGQAPAA